MRPVGLGRGFRHQRVQSALAIAAIATAVMLPVVLISVGQGVADHELGSLENSGYQIVISASGSHGIVGTHALAASIAGLPSVSAVSPVLSVPVEAVLPSGGSVPVLAEGVLPGAFAATLSPAERALFPLPLPLGDPSDAEHFANGTYAGPVVPDVLISSPLAQATGATVGEALALAVSSGAPVRANYTITGVFGVSSAGLGPTAVFAIVLPLSNLQVLTGLSRAGNGSASIVDASDTIEVALGGPSATNPTAINAVAARIAAIVPYYGVNTLDQQAQQLESASAVLTGFYLGLSSVGLSVGLLFLALVLLRRVENLRLSIGVRRAIGLPGRSIALEIVAYGLVLTAAGFVAGALAGVLLVRLLVTFGSATVAEAAGFAVFPPLLFAELAVGMLLLSLLASSVATRAALRLSLPEALR